jgi:hypothetical protein
VTAVIALALTAVKGVRAQETGIASALFNASQQIGVAFGLALLSTMAVTATARRLPDALAALYRGLSDLVRRAEGAHQTSRPSLLRAHTQPSSSGPSI